VKGLKLCEISCIELGRKFDMRFEFGRSFVFMCVCDDHNLFEICVCVL
jgi:hypothetical protein